MGLVQMPYETSLGYTHMDILYEHLIFVLRTSVIAPGGGTTDTPRGSRIQRSERSAAAALNLGKRIAKFPILNWALKVYNFLEMSISRVGS